MLDILQQHMAATATPELQHALAAAHATFERIGLEDYEQSFEDILMSAEDVFNGNEPVVQQVMQLTGAYQRQILRDHGVLVHDDVTVAQMNTLINGLLDIQSYSDLATLQATATLDGPAVEVFCEVMALVTEHDSPEITMTWVDEVDFALIQRLRELSARELTSDEQADDQARQREYTERLRRLLALPGMEPALDTVRAIRDGMKMGMPFAAYLQRLGFQLQFYTPQRCAQELYAMGVISRDASGNPRAAIHEHIEKFITSTEQITKIDVAVGELLVKMGHAT